MAYNPPDDDQGDDGVRTAYEEGYEAAQLGAAEVNPYTPSGHERDTTVEDERHYHWWLGYQHYEPGDGAGVAGEG